MHQDELYYFKKNVAFLRKANGLSQKEMAQKMMIGVETLRKLEQGITPPKLNACAVIMVISQFHVSAEELLKTQMENA